MAGCETERYCIIGAGASGLAVAKIFVERGIPFDLLEREADIGGLWNIATGSGIVYESTHLVSAITTTAFEDFPVATDAANAVPDYPGHAWVIDYFRRYVSAYGIGPHLQTRTAVECLRPRGDGTWDVKITGEAFARAYTGVVVANGHHDTPRMPSYPGQFTGDILHSRDYKSPRQLRDRRVLVVGAGNSACDILKDAAHASANAVVMSMRRGTWFVPKFLLGYPTGDILANIEWALTPLPRIVKRHLHQAALWVLQGPPSRYKLPEPTYSIDQSHPTMSDDIPRLVAHGRILVRPEIARFDGDDVVFVDGRRETVDLIVFATGYQMAIPFLDETYYLGADGTPRLFMNTAHPSHAGLYFAGLIQANGSIWRLAALQGRIIANAIIAQRQAPDEAAAFRSRVAAEAGPVSKDTFVASERHALEANYFDYARALKRVARSFRKAGSMRFLHECRQGVQAEPLRQAAE